MPIYTMDAVFSIHKKSRFVILKEMYKRLYEIIRFN